MPHHHLVISERGQITIPKKIRAKINVKFFMCDVENGAIVLKPMQTRDEFFAELDAAEKNWKKHGGKTLEEVMKKAKLDSRKLNSSHLKSRPSTGSLRIKSTFTNTQK